jgi:hypothetical protein
MTRILLIATVILLVLVLGVAGCRKSSGSKGGGYLPAPRGTVPAASA